MKHKFTWIRPWHDRGPQHISCLHVDRQVRISFDGCPFHGAALYSCSVDGVGHWEMTFQWKVEIDKVVTMQLVQSNGTAVYVSEGDNVKHNVIMVMS